MSGKDQSAVSKAFDEHKTWKQIIKQGLFKSKGYKLFKNTKKKQKWISKFCRKVCTRTFNEIKSDTDPNSTQQAFGDEVGSTEIILNASEIEPIKSKLDSLDVVQDRVNRILILIL